MKLYSGTSHQQVLPSVLAHALPLTRLCHTDICLFVAVEYPFIQLLRSLQTKHVLRAYRHRISHSGVEETRRPFVLDRRAVRKRIY